MRLTERTVNMRVLRLKKKVLEFTMICGEGKSFEEHLRDCGKKSCKNCKSLEVKTFILHKHGES